MKDQILHPDIVDRLVSLISDINVMLTWRNDEGEREMIEHDKEIIEKILGREEG